MTSTRHELSAKKPTPRRELRAFGLSLGVVCLLWAGGLAWAGRPGAVPWLGTAGPVLLLLAWLAPGALAPLHRVWMPAARALARLLTWILLTLVFYLVFTPFGMIMRATGRDPLHRRWERQAPTYWIQRRDGPFDPERTRRQY
jgi:hypothetical protein